MANYYCLMAGLPDLRLGDSKPALSLTEMKHEVEAVVSGRDRRLLDDYFLRFDCDNLVRLLDNPEAEPDERGGMDREQLLHIIDEARQTEGPVKGAPAFMADFVRTYDRRSTEPGWFSRDAVLLAYYDYVRRSPNAMMAEWYELNFNILNILTALIARRQGWPLQTYVQGTGEVVDAIVAQSAQPDFGLSAELDYVAPLMRAADTQDPVEKERQIDALRWQWLEEKTFFQPFDITALMAYLVRTEIPERRALRDPEQGRQRFTQIIEDLRAGAKVPEEFVRR